MSPKSAIIFILLGATCMSFAAFFVRLIETADGYQILFYRGMTQSLMVMIMACIFRRISVPRFIKNIDKLDIFLGVTMCIAFSFYVFALLNTSVASAMFILSIAPIFAALLSWLAIGEKPTQRSWLAIAIAFIGVSIMVSGGISLGRNLGNLFAAISALCFAIMLVTARKSKKTDVLTGNSLGAFFSVILMAALIPFLSNSFVIQTSDLVICLIMGAMTIGIGISLVSRGAPWLPAADVGLLVLIESVLSPIWVWIILGYAMTQTEIFGGLLIFLAIIIISKGKKTKSPT